MPLGSNDGVHIETLGVTDPNRQQKKGLRAPRIKKNVARRLPWNMCWAGEPCLDCLQFGLLAEAVSVPGDPQPRLQPDQDQRH